VSVTDPDYYTDSRIGVLEVVDDWNLPHRLGCALKYLKRYRQKPSPTDDLRKAKRYIELEIERMEEVALR
jgi:hypothetical protein